MQQGLQQLTESLSKDLSAIDEQREAADSAIECMEAKKLQLRQQLHGLDEKLHAAREAQRSWLAERDGRRRAVADVENQFRQRLQEADERGLAARKERAAAEKAQGRAFFRRCVSSWPRAAMW